MIRVRLTHYVQRDKHHLDGPVRLDPSGQASGKPCHNELTAKAMLTQHRPAGHDESAPSGI